MSVWPFKKKLNKNKEIKRSFLKQEYVELIGSRDNLESATAEKAKEVQILERLLDRQRKDLEETHESCEKVKAILETRGIQSKQVQFIKAVGQYKMTDKAHDL